MKTRLLLFAFYISSIACLAQDKSFSIIAFGDMPYFLPEDYARFDNVIKAVNEQNQVFTVHVGDIKSSNTPCSEEAYQKTLGYFQQFNKPLIYTPGDNEWTDCSKKDAGSYDPEERLGVIRKMFFPDTKSFGKEKIQLTSQSKTQGFAKYVENNRWKHNGISFATVHLVGSNNNFLPSDKKLTDEFFDRDKANIAWLNEVFTDAKASNSPGVVLFTQADMFNPDKESAGFENFLKELKRLTIDFGKQVVLVNGDSHKYIVDKPILRDTKTKKVLENFTRVQVFGEQDMHAVKITFNPSSPSFFYTEQLIVKGN